MQKNLPWKIIGILLSISAVILLWSFAPFKNLELLTYDARFKLKSPPPLSPQIFIIEIADDTIENLGAWPIPRDFHAELIAILRECGVKLTVFDVFFDQPTAEDELFSQSLQKAANVYLPVAFSLPEERKRKNAIISAESILSEPDELLLTSAKKTGHINIFVDADGKIRSLPLYIRHQDRIVPHLALQAACDWLGLNSAALRELKSGVVIDDRLFIPLTSDGAFLINYPAEWQKSFRHISYFDILTSYYSKKQKKASPKLNLEILTDTVCFIGSTATGTADLRPTPLENIYPMVGLHASVFNSIIQRSFIRDAGLPVNILISLLLFAVSLTICLKYSPLRAFRMILMCITAYCAFSLWLFNLGIWIGVFLPLCIFTLTYLGTTVYRFFAETRRRQLLEKELTIARDIQKNLLPQKIRVPATMTICAFFQPATFVAGDMYDIVEINEQTIGLFIADVAGKGVPAALIMSQTISFFRLISRRLIDCASVLGELNHELCLRLSDYRFVTGLYLVVDSSCGKACISSAGHLPALFYQKKTRTISRIDATKGLPLGIMADAAYEHQELLLEPGDKLLLFTDGLTEARNQQKEEFGLTRVEKVIVENETLSAHALSERIKTELCAFAAGAKQHDDICLLILEMC
jgi:CHASE2 domain-containing sensor protein